MMVSMSTLPLCSHLVANPCLLTNYPYLAIGSIGAAYSLTALQSHHITHILTLSPVCRVKYPDKFHYLKHSISDNCSTNIFLILDSCFEFIEQARLTHGRVLIHCFQGISRSATILSAYLMKYHQLSLEEALQAIREVRPIVQPNATFILSLKKFERQLKEERSGCAIDQREESSTNPSGEV